MRTLSFRGKIKKADKKIREIVRERDRECIVCGRWAQKPIDPSQFHAGHYIPRGELKHRFSLLNVNLECVTCNCFEDTTEKNEKYRKNLIKKNRRREGKRT